MVQRAQLLEKCAWLLHLTGDKASHEVDAVITGRIVPPWMFIGGTLLRVRYLLTLLTGNREAEQWAYDAYVNSVPDQHAVYCLAVCYAHGACYF